MLCDRDLDEIPTTQSDRDVASGFSRTFTVCRWVLNPVNC